MNTVRAKFTVNSITRNLGKTWDDTAGKSVFRETHTVKMYVVQGGSEENKAFFVSTPSGSIELSTIQPDMFQLGGEYDVDFTPAKSK